MQKEETAMIPFFVHESAVNRLERMNRRLLILLLVIFIAFVGTNAYWIWFENQFEDTVVTQDVDTGEGTAVLSGTGDVFYGTDTTDSKDTP